MSATLRHNVGVQIANAIEAEDADALAPFGSKQVGVYAGTGKPDWQAVGFAIKLPKQIAEGYALMQICEHVAGMKALSDTPVVAIKGCHVLALKLAVSFGLPGPYAAENPDLEQAFLKSLSEKPGELATWMAYADYLQEQDCPAARRGAVIAGWLGKRAMKVKYGVPELAREFLKEA
jgi:uncharacterized protein (TIGR02996 family)